MKAKMRIKLHLALFLTLVMLFSVISPITSIAAVITVDTNRKLTAEAEETPVSAKTTLYDFEYVTGEENKGADNYIPSFSLPSYDRAWLTNNGESITSVANNLYSQDVPLYIHSNTAIANGVVTADVVSRKDSEPVHFGDKSLKISFDFSAHDTESTGTIFLRVTDPMYRFKGSPSAIGCWVYVPEGTANHNLYLNCAGKVDTETGSSATSYQCLTSADALGTEKSGINWTGWKYLEFDLTGQKGYTGILNVGSQYEPYGFSPSCGVFWISYKTADMGEDKSDTIYLDDISLIYGSDSSDTLNPTISYIGDIHEQIVDNETVYTTNTNTFKAMYTDTQEVFMSGIDNTATKMYIDGVDVTDKCYIDANYDEIYFYDAVLSDGIHNIRIDVVDYFGNKTTETRYFTIDSKTSDAVCDHDFLYSDGSLSCSKCSCAIPATGFNGTVKDSETNLPVIIKNGIPVKNKWTMINYNFYYLGKNGVAVTGNQTIDKKTYTFSEDGKLQLKNENFAMNDLFYYFDAQSRIFTTHIEDHPYVKVIDEAVAPQIGVSGLTEGEHCQTCNKIIIKQQVIPALEEPAIPVPPATDDPPVIPNPPSDGDTDSDYKPGDLNGDNKITAADARLALRIAAKLEPNTDPAIIAVADINSDGNITAADARLILRKAAKLDL